MVQHFRAGGFFTDTIGDILFMWGQIGTEDNVTHLRREFLAAGYQVTAAKTLYLAKLQIAVPGTGSGLPFILGYADNDVGLDTATARTAPVMAIGIDDTADNGLMAVQSGVEDVLDAFSDKGMVIRLAAAAKFPFFRIGGASVTYPVGIYAWCFEL